MTEMKFKVAVSLSFLASLIVLVGCVHASTNVFVLEPSKDVTQAVECPSSCQSICGNVTTVGSSIDLYVVDPLGNTVLHYENISFADFKVNTVQNGTYVIHLANRLSTENVTATLFYGRNFAVNPTWHIATTWTATIASTTATFSPIFNPLVGPFGQILYDILIGVVSTLIGGLLLGLIRRRYQNYKDGPSKTPVVIR